MKQQAKLVSTLRENNVLKYSLIDNDEVVASQMTPFIDSHGRMIETGEVVDQETASKTVALEGILGRTIQD